MNSYRTNSEQTMLQIAVLLNLIPVWIYCKGSHRICFMYSFIVFFSTVFSILYHHSHEQQFYGLDVGFAYATIFANIILVCTIQNRFILFGSIMALLSLHFYYYPEKYNYTYSHTYWHILIALANTCFAIGLLTK